MKEVKAGFESSLMHMSRLTKPSDNFRALYSYLSFMFPDYSFSINQQATEVLLTHPKNTDYVVIYLSNNYMISTVTYHSNEEIYEND